MDKKIKEFSKIIEPSGFITIVDVLGDDLTVVNSARVSLGKRKNHLDDDDIKLIGFLAKEKHYSPFRHCIIQFHIKIPEFVARQFYKHIVGSDYAFKDHAWNEISGRYVTYENEWWFPNYFRKKAENIKQGSLEEIVNDNEKLLKEYQEHIKKDFEFYNYLLKCGICNEQARTVLPINFYTEFYWTASLQTVQHFVELRKDKHAQREIQEIAIVFDEFLKQIFPHSWCALMGGNNGLRK